MPQYLAQQWESYEREIIPRGAPPVQRQESRRAFYAGAAALMDIIFGNLTPDAEPTDEDLQMMSDIADELHDFGQAIAGGRA